MKLINRNKHKCGFCNEDNILVTGIRVEDKEGVDIKQICHICFNEARYMEKGLYYKGHQIFVDFRPHRGDFTVKMIQDSSWNLRRK